MYRSHMIVNGRAILGPLAAIRTLEARRSAAVVHLMPLQVPLVDVPSAATLADEPLSENAPSGST